MFNIPQAIRLTNLSRIIYQVYTPMKKSLAEIGLQPKDYEYIEQKDTQMLVIHNKETQVIEIVFRGTKGIPDWITDINCKIVHTQYGGVHAGVYTGYRAIEDDLLSILSAYPNYKIDITGHSLGFGLATVCACSLMSFYEDNISSIYGIGGMKCLNREGKEWYNKNLGAKTFRIEDNDDIVTRLPINFQSIGERILSDDNKTWKDKMKNIFQFKFFREEHDAGKYLENLKRKQECF